MEVPNSKNGVSVRAYQGDAMTLLAFDLDESKTENFAGFSVRITPGPRKPYYLTNLLTYPTAILKKNNIKPDSTKSDVTDLTKDAHNELQDLTTKPKGADWDKDFVDKEIDGHKKVLDKLQDAKKATTNPELGEMLTKATANITQKPVRVSPAPTRHAMPAASIT